MRTRMFVAAFLTVVPAAMAQSVAGLWDATVKINNLVIPFRMEFSGEGSAVVGTFFNGDERFTSTSGRLENGSLVVDWDHYLSELQATWKDGVLTGSYTHGGRRGGTYPFEAHPH